jgi:hypothetical protein
MIRGVLFDQDHGVYVVVAPIGEAKGREAVGQQHDDIATIPRPIGDLEDTPVGGAIGHRWYCPSPNRLS